MIPRPRKPELPAMKTMSATLPHPREQRILELGGQLLDEARHAGQGPLLRGRQEDRLLHQLMADDALRVQALRFVDVLPALRHDADLVRHLEEYLGDRDIPLPIPGLSHLPGLTHWGLRHARRGLAAHLAAAAVRATVGAMARRFIAGADARTALNQLHRLHRRGMGFTLDVLGEATVSAAEEAIYQKSYLDLLDQLHDEVPRWPAKPRPGAPAGPPSPVVNLSIKISGLYSQLDPADLQGSVAGVKDRLRPILLRARTTGAFINLDMEQYDTKEITLRVAEELLDEPALRDWRDVGVVLQAYLRETETDLARLLDWLKRRGTPITVRLVRGAYWDYETVLAQQHGWPTPVWTLKGETDACYERCLHTLLANHALIDTAIGTHNVRSLAVAMIDAQELGLSPNDYEFQMLYGMADPLKEVLVNRGHRLRVYAPLGQLIPGMAYLVRRLLENTSSQSFLRMGFAEHQPLAVLMAKPEDIRIEQSKELTSNSLSSLPNRKSQIPNPKFFNEPLHRFTNPEERAKFQAAIEQVRGCLGDTYPLVIAGDSVPGGGGWHDSINPAQPSQIVGRAAVATIDDANRAVAAAGAAAKDWRTSPPTTAPNTFAPRPPFCAAGAMSSPPGRFLKRARPGARPTPTWWRPSIFWSITLAKPSAWLRPSASMPPVKPTSRSTSRAASGRSSRPGTSRWRS